MPALEPPLESTPTCSLTCRVTSKFKFTPLSWGLAPVVTPTLTRSLIARVALTRAPPRRACADVQTVDAQRFSHILKRVGFAGQSRDRVRQLKRLEPRQAARGFLKQDASKNFIVRQARIGADLKRRLHCGARDGDLGGDAARARLGDEIEIGHHIAMKRHVSAGEGEARTQKHERAAQELEAPRDLRRAGGAVHVQISTQFGVDAAAADENAVHCGDCNTERRIEWRRAAAGLLCLRRERKARPRRRSWVQMFRAGQGSRNAGEAIGHGNIHADDRDLSVDFWPLGKGTGDVERQVGGRGDNVVGDELRVLAVQANGAGKASGGIKPHFTGDADRTGVRRHSGQMIDPNRAPIRDECSSHAG